MRIGMHGFVVRAHDFVIVVITRKKSCFCNCHMEQKFIAVTLDKLQLTCSCMQQYLNYIYGMAITSQMINK